MHELVHCLGVHRPAFWHRLGAHPVLPFPHRFASSIPSACVANNKLQNHQSPASRLRFLSCTSQGIPRSLPSLSKSLQFLNFAVGITWSEIRYRFTVIQDVECWQS